jgi:HSP20 family protein
MGEFTGKEFAMNRSLTPWRGSMSSPFSMFRREMDDLIERLFRPEEADGLTFPMHTDVAETENHLEVSVELPGLKPDDIHVEIKDGDLWITGEKKEETEKKDKTFVRVERKFGHFRHVVPLGESVDPEKVTAEFRDGVLKLVIPKSEAAKPRRIPIKGTSEEPKSATSGSASSTPAASQSMPKPQEGNPSTGT